MLDFTARLVDIAHNELRYELNPNLVMTLADHINFCIQRARRKIVVQMPLICEIEQSFPKETKIGKYAVRQIERRFAVQLDENEASGSATAFVNARNSMSIQDKSSVQDWYKEALDKFNKIKEALNNKDMKNYSVEVHSLKSDARYFGIDKLAAISLDHELKSKENDIKYVSENFKNLENEFNKIIEIVSNYLK